MRDEASPWVPILMDVEGVSLPQGLFNPADVLMEMPLPANPVHALQMDDSCEGEQDFSLGAFAIKFQEVDRRAAMAVEEIDDAGAVDRDRGWVCLLIQSLHGFGDPGCRRIPIPIDPTSLSQMCASPSTAPQNGNLM